MNTDLSRQSFRVVVILSALGLGACKFQKEAPQLPTVDPRVTQPSNNDQTTNPNKSPATPSNNQSTTTPSSGNPATQGDSTTAPTVDPQFANLTVKSIGLMFPFSSTSGYDEKLIGTMESEFKKFSEADLRSQFADFKNTATPITVAALVPLLLTKMKSEWNFQGSIDVCYKYDNASNCLKKKNYTNPQIVGLQVMWGTDTVMGSNRPGCYVGFMKVTPIDPMKFVTCESSDVNVKLTQDLQSLFGTAIQSKFAPPP